MDENKISSELLGLLNNIEGLITCYLGSARSNSRSFILEAVAQEAQMLCVKLKRMRKRWTVLLPFHEALDVNFWDWAMDVEEWLKKLKEPANQLSAGFLLDMVCEPVDELEGDVKVAMPEICHRIESRLKEAYGDWEERAFPELRQAEQPDQESGMGLTDSWVRAVSQLVDLKCELVNLDTFYNSALTEKQFRALSLRMYHKICKDAEKEARNEVNKAHNSWPAKNVARRALAMKESVKGQIMAHDVFRGLEEYIDLDYPEMFEEATFGQFIFMNRHRLQDGDVYKVVKMLLVVQMLNGDYVDPTGTQRKKEKRAMGRELTAEEKQIVKGLLQLVERGRWRKGATAASMSQGLCRMLGVEYALEGELAEMSEDLWKLLKSRPRCDAEKSLKVTWLNIVGWCVRKGYLSGSGGPALCKEFYPKAGNDDYKAIDKGRSEPAVSFTKIEPLLEKFLK